MRKAPGTLVIRSHQPWRTWLIVVVVLVAMLAGGWWLYNTGRDRAGHNFDLLRQEIDTLNQRIQELEARNSQLKDENAILQRARQVEEKGYGEIRNSLQDLQTEILELKEEVAFYRSIVAPYESSGGLRIQTLQVTPNGERNGYRYKLVLTQVMTKNRTTSGRVSFTLEGLLDGQSSSIEHKQLVVKEKNYQSFKFKYFQNLEDDMRLPEGFAPQRIVVNIRSNTVNLEKTFEWSEITTSG
jgi:hypothetical protein